MLYILWLPDCSSNLQFYRAIRAVFPLSKASHKHCSPTARLAVRAITPNIYNIYSQKEHTNSQ